MENIMRELEGTARNLLVEDCPLDQSYPASLSACRECEHFNTEFSDKITCLFDPDNLPEDEDEDCE
jgi:hypothetical protein